MAGKAKGPGGRPTKYTDKIAAVICGGIATTTSGLHKICASLDVCPSTVYGWLDNKPEFLDKYMRAKAMQADLMDEYRLSVASGEYRIDPDKPEKFVDTSEAIQRDKLLSHHLQWSQSQLAPKKYGSKLSVEVQSPADKLASFINTISSRND